jgi:hypothetical protein
VIIVKNIELFLGAVAHTCNRSFSEGVHRRIIVGAQPGHKASEILSQRTRLAWLHIRMISALGEAEVGDHHLRLELGMSMRVSEKLKQKGLGLQLHLLSQKYRGRVVQHLPNKCET